MSKKQQEKKVLKPKPDASYILLKEAPSRAAALIKGLKSKQDMIILKEILGPPKSLQ